MKQFRQSIALFMVLSMLLSMVSGLPVAYAAESEDTSVITDTDVGPEPENEVPAGDPEGEIAPLAAGDSIIDVNYSEDTQVGTWKDASNGSAWSNVALQADATASNGYVLRVSSMGQGNVVYNDAFPAAPTGDITYEIRMKGEGAGQNYWVPSLAWGIQTDGNHNAVRLVKSRNGGDFFLETKSAWTTDNAQIAVPGTTADLYAPKNEWKVLKLSYNSAAKKVDLYIDDVLALSQYNWGALGDAPGKVGFRPWAVTSTYYIDYIKVTEGTFTAPGAPTVTTQPISVTQEALKMATFTAVADGEGLSYQWQKAKDGSGHAWENIAGATAAGYTTGTLQVTDTGAMYRCHITKIDEEGAAQAVNTDAATLTVTAASGGPEINTQPVGGSVGEGLSHTLTVVASIKDGVAGTLTYQWQKSADGTGNWADIDNATGADYMFNVTETAHYRCVVTSNGQSVISGSAEVVCMASWPYYSQFGEGDKVPRNWFLVGSKTPKLTGDKVTVIDDPSATDGKVLKLDLTNSSDYGRLYSTDLPTGIADGEIALRVKATRASADSGTDEIRMGMLFRVDTTGKNDFHEVTRSGSGWFLETPKGWGSGLAAGSNFTPGQWHTLRVIFQGTKVSFWVDELKVLEEYDASDRYYSIAGGFGIRSWFDKQTVYIDNLYIGPVRSDEEMEQYPEFTLNTAHGESFNYERGYTEADAIDSVNWADANTQTAHSAAQTVSDEDADDGKALELTLGGGTAVLVDGDSSYTGNAAYSIRFKAAPTGEFIYDADPMNPDPSNPGGMGNPVKTTGDMAFLYRYESQTTYGVLYYDAKKGQLELRDGNNINLTRGIIATGFYLERDTWYTLRLRYKDKNVKVWLDRGSGEEVIGTFVATNSSYPTNVGRIGLGAVNNPMTLTIDHLSQNIYEGVMRPDPAPEHEAITIASADMTVSMDNRFPVPNSYTIGSKTTKAQQDYAYVLEIDGAEWLAKVISAEKSGDDTLVYKVTAFEENESSRTKIDLTFTYQVVGTALKCEITVDDEHGYRMESFEMPGVRLGQFSGAVGASANNIAVGGFVNPGTWNNTSDKFVTLGNGLSAEVIDYSIGFIYDGAAAVGLVTNSTETPTRNRVTVAGDDTSDLSNPIAKYVSITSGIWKLRPPLVYVERYTDAVEKLRYETLKPMAFTVIVTGDNNGDAKADWQDAANLYRDHAEVPLGGADIRDYYSYVSFNFAGLAENPFIRGLDNGKKLYNYTDGFGQMILEKGYQAEGHDDSHPDVGGHIGVRQGGADDFNILIDEGKKLNMKIGIHVNVGEYILDSYFVPDIDIFRRDASGYPNSRGWGWIDQAFYFDDTADLLSGQLYDRFNILKKDAPGLDWVYVDIYSGSDWDARMVSDTLNDFGWMNATEFSGPMEQNVVWTHWGTDLYYPTSGDGSKVFRYIYNDTKDAYPTTSPSVSKLLRGAVQPGIGTWQNRTSITEGVQVFYAQNLPSKYMQYFPVARWQENEVLFGAPKSYNEDGSVKTVHTDKAGARSVFANNETRIYAPDGTLVGIMNYSTGSDNKIRIATSSGGNTTMYQRSQVFMPWDPINETKIYYYNSYTQAGAQTTWDLPDSWDGVTTAYIYKLTATGYEEPVAVPVADGKLDLSTLSLNTPYVIHKDSTSKLPAAADWGATEAANTVHTNAKGYLADQGFDTYTKDHWQVKAGTGSNVTIKDDQRGNGIMAVAADMENSTVVENIIKNLTPGQTYSASIWLQIGGGGNTAEQRPVTLRVNDGGGVLLSSEYTLNRSIVRNMDETGKWKYSNSPDYRYMSRIEVTFTATAPTAVLQVEVGAGSPVVVFDDAKLWKFISEPTKLQDQDIVYFESFENITENYGPFVYQCGGGNSTHLAEKAPEFITVGGEQFKTSQFEHYVIDGNWSLKTWESDPRDPILRTNPATLEFKSGETYYVSFQYATKTADGSYAAQLRDGSGAVKETIELKRTANYQTPQTAMFAAFTPDSDDWYVTIGNTVKLPAVHTDFLVLDNFMVSKSANVVIISGQPESGSYLQGESAALTVSVVGPADAVTYQWYKNTQATVDGAQAIPGATGASYTPDTEVLGTTYYYVAITGGSKSLNSSIAAVAVTENTGAPVQGVTLDKTEAALYTNIAPRSVTLTATVSPNYAANKALTWSSSDERVATVENGVVTAVGNGTAVITVRTVDGGKTATCTVTVATYSSGGTGGTTPDVKEPESSETDRVKDVKTVVDAATGTTVETKTYESGKIVETAHKTDGEVNVKVTAPNGNVIATVTIPAEVESAGFADVPNSFWAQESIGYTAGLGLFKGIGENTFAPNTLMTRSMFVAVLHRLSGEAEGDKALSFMDVRSGAYYESAVLWAAGNEIVKGYSEDIFASDDNITREMLAVMLYRYAAVLGLDTGLGKLDSFTDETTVSSWAAPAMSWAVKHGLITGKPGSRLDPLGTATRAEVSAILYRLCGMIGA